jgi:ATP-dependent DNA helicase RecQ
MAEQKLDQVIEFSELQHCRRGYLLKYFGEVWETVNCGNCDSCMTPKEEIDATEISYKILSAVIRTGERFGANHVVDVLLGKGTKKIKELGHDDLPVFGVEKKYEKEEIRHFITALLSLGFLAKNDGQYPTLRVSDLGKESLKYRQKIFLAKPRNVKESVSKKQTEDLDFDQTLFNKLKVFRKELADQKNVPPFVIFSDVSLREMSHYLPLSLESFSRITGVGAMKLTQYGELFLRIIQNYAQEHGKEEIPIPMRQKDVKASHKLNQRVGEDGLNDRSKRSGSLQSSGSTFQKTKELFTQKLSLVEIAEQRGVNPGTILTHLETLIEEGEQVDIAYLAMDADRLRQIRSAFKEAGGFTLTPVRRILGESFTYEELRLARVFIQIESKVL